MLLGNSSLRMRVNGRTLSVPASSKPIAYRVTPKGRRSIPASVSADLLVSARAGIVVTGTEVLTGRVADRNGPWLAERLRDLGVEIAHIAVVGDRPGDIEAALRLLSRRGNGPRGHQRAGWDRRPTTSPRRWSASSRGGRSSSTRRWNGASGRSSSRCWSAGLTSIPRRCGRRTASRRSCRPAPPCSSRSARPPASSYRRRGTGPEVRRWWCCPGRRASCSRCG